MFYWFPVFLITLAIIAAVIYLSGIFGKEDRVAGKLVDAKPASAMLLSVLGVIFLIAASAFWPQVNIYGQEMDGKAELARAEFSRKVKVAEAQATMDSSKLLAEAEIERAKGAAEANRIIADGLGGPDGYLRYLSIQAMEKAAERGNSIIYIPTDGVIPVTEAGRATSTHPTPSKKN